MATATRQPTRRRVAGRRGRIGTRVLEFSGSSEADSSADNLGRASGGHNLRPRLSTAACNNVKDRGNASLLASKENQYKPAEDVDVSVGHANVLNRFGIFDSFESGGAAQPVLEVKPAHKAKKPKTSKKKSQKNKYEDNGQVDCASIQTESLLKIKQDLSDAQKYELHISNGNNNHNLSGRGLMKPATPKQHVMLTNAKISTPAPRVILGTHRFETSNLGNFSELSPVIYASPNVGDDHALLDKVTDSVKKLTFDSQSQGSSPQILPPSPPRYQRCKKNRLGQSMRANISEQDVALTRNKSIRLGMTEDRNVKAAACRRMSAAFGLPKNERPVPVLNMVSEEHSIAEEGEGSVAALQQTSAESERLNSHCNRLHPSTAAESCNVAAELEGSTDARYVNEERSRPSSSISVPADDDIHNFDNMILSPDVEDLSRLMAIPHSLKKGATAGWLRQSSRISAATIQQSSGSSAAKPATFLQSGTLSQRDHSTLSSPDQNLTSCPEEDGENEKSYSKESDIESGSDELDEEGCLTPPPSRKDSSADASDASSDVASDGESYASPPPSLVSSDPPRNSVDSSPNMSADGSDDSAEYTYDDSLNATESLQDVGLGASETTSDINSRLSTASVMSTNQIKRNVSRLSVELQGAPYYLNGMHDDSSPLDEVLHVCQQQNLLEWHEAFPQRMIEECTKIGEGVYGEVFRAINADDMSVALKVIPIEGSDLINGERQKSLEEILPEILIAQATSKLRDNQYNCTPNFVEVNSVTIVKGPYPDVLLHKWDEFARRKTSENDRPDIFPQDQLFIVFEFGDGGEDFESVKLNSPLEGVSVLTQVVWTLAVAEQAMEFEHRDLHIGNILVKRTHDEYVHYILNGHSYTVKTQGIMAYIIDFTNSRLKKDRCTIHTDLSTDDALFEGPDDEYQFEIYRMMKAHNNNEWKMYCPKTNIFWVHYLVLKMLEWKKYGGRKLSKKHELAKLLREMADNLVENNESCMHALIHCIYSVPVLQLCSIPQQ